MCYKLLDARRALIKAFWVAKICESYLESERQPKIICSMTLIALERA